MPTGICGTGKMGSAMAERLMEQGFKVMVWNRTKSRAQPLLDQGAEYADTPAALAEACDTVIDMVIDDAAAIAVYDGKTGLLAGDLSDKIIIEMSTIKPQTVRKLGAAVKAKGGKFVESPVGGSVTPARNGQLIGLVGGEEAALNAALPVLEALCRRIDHVGPLGSGAAMKLAVNLPLIVYWAALGEALSIAGSAGIDLNIAADILADTSGTIKVAPARIPWVIDTIGGHPPEEAGFDIAGMVKDAQLMNDYAAEKHINAPVIKVARDAYAAAHKEGWSARDGSLLAAWRYRHEVPKS